MTIVDSHPPRRSTAFDRLGQEKREQSASLAGCAALTLVLLVALGVLA